MAKSDRHSGVAIALLFAIAGSIPLSTVLMNSRVEAADVAPAEQTFQVPQSLPKGSQVRINEDASTQAISESLKVGFEPSTRDRSPQRPASQNAEGIGGVTLVDPQASPNTGLNGWWLLLPLAGIPLFAAWVLKKKQRALEAGAIGMTGAAKNLTGYIHHSDQSRLIMVPKDSQQAYAYWELSELDREFLTDHPHTDLKLRVHDVTPDGKASQSFRELPCDRLEADCQVPIPEADRSYLAQLGYRNPDGVWTKFATSSPVYVPHTETREPQDAALNRSKNEASNPGIAIPFTQGVPSIRASWINLIPHSSHQAEVTWHLSDSHIKQVETKNLESLRIRIHNAHHLPLKVDDAPQTLEFAVDIHDQALTVDLPHGDRDYVAELGYYNPDYQDSRWVSLTRSIHSHLPKADQDGSRVLIMPCDPYHLSLSKEQSVDGPKAYVYWDIASKYKNIGRANGGNILVLRLYGHLTGDRVNPKNYRQLSEHIIQEDDRDRVIALPEGDRYYRAEVGYLTIQGKFLSIGKSEPILIPHLSIREA